MRLRTRRLMRLSSGDEVFALKLKTKLAFNLCPPLRPLNALRVNAKLPALRHLANLDRATRRP